MRNRIFVVFLLCNVALTAASPVIYLRLTDSQSLDPGKAEDFYSMEVIYNVFEGLIRLSPDTLAVEPCLAESWSCQENGKRWIFHLRRGVKFHNGDDFNSRAVVYTFKKRMEKKWGEYIFFGRFFPYIKTVKALDDWMVEITLSRPHTLFPFALVDTRACVVAPGSCDGPEFKPIGTGPYVFSEWSPNRFLVLTRFKRYWQQPAKLEKIIFKREPNVALRLLQIKNHSADIDLVHSAKEYDELLGKTDIGIMAKPVLNTFFLGFNRLRPPFALREAREAFAHLLDRGIMVRQIYQNFAAPANGFLPPQMAVPDPALTGYDFSPQKARQLLRHAGLATGFSCHLYFAEGQFGLEEIARIIAAQARLLHVNVKNVKLPFPNLLRALEKGEPDLFLIGWAATVDPSVFLNPLFMLNPGGGNHILSVSPEYGRILDRVVETTANQERGRLYVAAQRLLHEELPLLPLFHLNSLFAYNKRLRGLRMNLMGFLIFKDASLEPE